MVASRSGDTSSSLRRPARARHHALALGRREVGGEPLRSNAGPPRAVYLIAHQRYERAHHQGQAAQQERRDLIEHALAAARGQDAERVPASQHGADERLLPGT